MTKTSLRLISIGAISAFVGIVDTIYLTVSHFQSSEVVCSIVEGCNLVLSSSWATIFGVPTSLIGLVYYLFVFGLFIYIYFSRSQTALLAAAAVVTVGFLMSMWFLYLQIFVIEAICEYCLLSVIATTVMWIVVLTMVRRQDD